MIRTAVVCAGLAVLAGPVAGQGRGKDRAPAKGSLAPDFTLHRLTAEGVASEEQVQLSKLAADRPVALVFGSYT